MNQLSIALKLGGSSSAAVRHSRMTRDRSWVLRTLVTPHEHPTTNHTDTRLTMADDSSTQPRRRRRRRQRPPLDPNGTDHVARGNVEDVPPVVQESTLLVDVVVDDPRARCPKRHLAGNKIVAAQLSRHAHKRQEADQLTSAVNALYSDPVGLLEAETDMERTSALTQEQLRRLLDPASAKHIYDLKLTESAPYGLEYDRSGRYAIAFGHKGHLAVMDCLRPALQAEWHVGERIRDACFLHNYTILAAAQKNHVFLYDSTGVEIHRLDAHTDVAAMNFLPYHWLLSTIGRAGVLKYQDTSTGQLVSEHKTKLGPCHVLRQNPTNAVLHAGHSNGTVTLWSPASSHYLVKMLAHKGAAVHSLAVDPSGRYMVTGGADNQVKIWDLRMYRTTHAYYTKTGIPISVDISQRGILGIGHATHVDFWSAEALPHKVHSPYMHHPVHGTGGVERVRFRPYEDVCGIGHGAGISSIVIPGAGEPNLDTDEFHTNPLADRRQRQEAEVRALLDKLSPQMIGLDVDKIGGMETSEQDRLERVEDLQEAANALIKSKKAKAKKRGRSKIQTKLRRKQANIVDQATLKLREAREKEKALAGKEVTDVVKPKDTAPAALKRFF